MRIAFARTEAEDWLCRFSVAFFQKPPHHSVKLNFDFVNNEAEHKEDTIRIAPLSI